MEDDMIKIPKLQGGIKMNYMVEVKGGKWNVYSPKIDMYVMENVTDDEVKVALAMDMEYEIKLEIIKLFMTFPHGFLTMDGRMIVHKEAVEEYEAWRHETHQRIGFQQEYHSLIDEKLNEMLT